MYAHDFYPRVDAVQLRSMNMSLYFTFSQTQIVWWGVVGNVQVFVAGK